ncbi:MAG: hypothetical protein PHC51_01705 [bacterium]|nr:hypothetical protein [bacterium]
MVNKSVSSVKKILSGIYIFLLLAIAAHIPSTVFASPDSEGIVTSSETSEKQEPEEPQKLERGVISSFGSFKRSAGVELKEQAEIKSENNEEAQSVVNGSVKQISRGKCEAVINNNSSKSSYSVKFQVVGYNSAGSKAFSKSFAGRVAAGESFDRQFSCREGLNMELVIISGKKL